MLGDGRSISDPLSPIPYSLNPQPSALDSEGCTMEASIQTDRPPVISSTEVFKMFVRIVRPQVASGKAEEAAKRWEAFMGPRAKANPKFQRGYMAATSDRSSVVAVTFWEELPDEATTKQIMSEIQAEMQDLMTGPPAMEQFEVLAQI